MSNTFNWKINKMEVIPNFNGFNNYVFRVHWEYNGVDETNLYSSKIVNYVEFSEEESHNYIEYTALTESDVISWVESKYNINELQDILTKKINDLKSPEIIELKMPWIPEPEVVIEINDQIIDTNSGTTNDIQTDIINDLSGTTNNVDTGGYNGIDTPPEEVIV